MKPLLRLCLALPMLLLFHCAINPISGRMPAVPARTYLFRDEAGEAGMGAYGYLVLTRRPGAADSSRYAAICEAYKRNLEPRSAFAGVSQASRIMLTYWMLSDTSSDMPIDEKCQALVESYDYARAVQIANAVYKNKASGPLLVALKYQFASSGSFNRQALVLDMSNFPESEFDRAFSIWKDRIVREPKVWNKGFKWVKIREALRGLLNQYGEDIAGVITAG